MNVVFSRSKVYATGLHAGHGPRHAHTLRAFAALLSCEGYITCQRIVIILCCSFLEVGITPRLPLAEVDIFQQEGPVINPSYISAAAATHMHGFVRFRTSLRLCTACDEVWVLIRTYLCRLV